jgi:hypothetical protein
MRPGRELDTRIAQEVFGHKVWARAKILLEDPATGERPLRSYTKEMEWAWEVAKVMNITLIPIEGGQWFAFVGPMEKQGWDSPTAVLEFLATGNFKNCGAYVGTDTPLVICMAALNACDKRKAAAEEAAAEEGVMTNETAKDSDSAVH